MRYSTGESRLPLRPFDLRAPAGDWVPVNGVILVVEDDNPVRAMLARLLSAQGYSILQASNASEARRLLALQRPDLVISDIVMPGESGIELRRHIGTLFPQLPVILVSGYSAEGPAEFAARTPNTSFVQKPFVADKLIELVGRALEGKGQYA